MIRLDLQVHTKPASPDSFMTPDEVIARCLEDGLDGAALTEHLAWDTKEVESSFLAAGLLLIPAREISCGIAHILVLADDRSLTQELPKSLSVQELKDLSGVARIWAHPAAPAGSSAYAPNVPDAGELTAALEAAEVLNGRHLQFASAVSSAAAFASANGLARSGGSDAHRRVDVGRCFTWVEAPSSAGVEGVIQAIKAGKIEPGLSMKWAADHGYEYRSDLADYLG